MTKRKHPSPTPEDVTLIDRLNVGFKMFDIPMTASFQEHERGVRRPYRLHCSPNLEMGERERLGVWLSKHQPFAAFGTRAQIDKYAQRIIRRQQERDS